MHNVGYVQDNNGALSVWVFIDKTGWMLYMRDTCRVLSAIIRRMATAVQSWHYKYIIFNERLINNNHSMNISEIKESMLLLQVYESFNFLKSLTQIDFSIYKFLMSILDAYEPSLIRIWKKRSTSFNE